MKQTPTGKSKSTDGATLEATPLAFRAAFVPASVDPAQRTVDVVFSTGAAVLQKPLWDDPFFEVLSLDPANVRLDRFNNSAPLCDGHPLKGGDYRAVIVRGVIVPGTAKVNGTEGRCTVRFTKAGIDPDADMLFQKIQDGIVVHVSVGYRVYAYEITDNVEDRIQTRTAVDWEPVELSTVSAGEDDGATFRSADHCSTNVCRLITRNAQENPMKKTPEELAIEAERERASGIRLAVRAANLDEAFADELIANGVTLDAARAAITAKTPATTSETTIRNNAAKTERERGLGIRSAVRAAKLDDAFADELVTNGTTLDAARALIITKLAEADNAKPATNGVNSIEIVADEKDKWFRGAGSWLLHKAGVADMVAKATKTEPEKIIAGEFRGMSLLDIARECLERQGVKTRGMNKMELAGQALMFRNAGMQSTSDFATLLENTMHKVLQAAYATTPDTWSRFCARGTVSDFRAHNRYRLGMFGRLDTLNQAGEFKNKPILDAEKATITAGTVGNIIALSRQSIVNDDMSAFNRLATMLGRAGKLSIEIDVYSLILLNAGLGPVMGDGQTLFHATHGNIGTGAAISVATIDADRVLMAKQTEPNGNEYLDLRPTKLLVPVELGGTARVINGAPYDPDTANKLQRPNMVYSLFNDIVDTPRITGTRRYAFADPTVAPVIEVAFLDGQSEPVLESQDGWRTDGVEWKARLDYGVAAVDTRGATTNAGV